MPSAIQVKNLSFYYQSAGILNNCTFEIQANEFIGIIGPNGGGKTTLLKLLLGFLKPSSGNIEIFGHSPGINSHRKAYVPQAVRFDPQFPISVFEVVLSGRLASLPWYGRYSQKDKKLAAEALERVGIAKMLYNQAYGKLSGGQAQRVLIARALVAEPEILFLDEPTASVDAQAESDIFNLLSELKGSMVILMVTHNLKAAISQVQRVLCVQGTVLSLKPEEVCEHFGIGLYHTPLIKLK
ncbi:ATP-binding cassette domain-containing protein [Parachlamydia sp. AcF125]|uniref:metal ABC transporter ATP-binding protein n=1 Tax=Parachlamydia sp. AcF125 TaxID=2795736 RepID=UPI001BCA6648|nr:ATP-binding cassette domain-containing protein [Parachlamydia sp. AcF125]MBS4167586.1 High-affinity zinc uptake system ATP-binding protein ZnuC [Parachlamydia sp. AcF125]